MESEELDGDTQIFCDICKKMVKINFLCEHFEVQESQETEETPEMQKCTDETNGHGSFEEALISAMQAQPILWDPTVNISRKSKSAKDQAWLAIFYIFDEKYSIEFIKKKWKNLKDTYIKTKNDIETYVPSGSGATKRKKPWKFFESMKFLSDQQPKRLTVTNLTSPPLLSPPSDGNQSSSSPKGSKRKCDPVENALLEAIKQFPPPPQLRAEQPQQKPINPICIRISEMLEEMSGREKAEAELKLLQTMFDIKYNI